MSTVLCFCCRTKHVWMSLELRKSGKGLYQSHGLWHTQKNGLEEVANHGCLLRAVALIHLHENFSQQVQDKKTPTQIKTEFCCSVSRPMAAAATRPRVGQLMRAGLLDCVHMPSSKFEAANRCELLGKSEDCKADSNRDLNEQGHDVANMNNANNEKKEVKR